MIIYVSFLHRKRRYFRCKLNIHISLVRLVTLSFGMSTIIIGGINFDSLNIDIVCYKCTYAFYDIVFCLTSIK